MRTQDESRIGGDDSFTSGSEEVPSRQGPKDEDDTFESYTVGQTLDWDSEFRQIELGVELPFWLFVPDCEINLNMGDYTFKIKVRNHFVEVHWGQFYDSRKSMYYIGNPPVPFPVEVQELIEKNKPSLPLRKCKTYLVIITRCQSDMLEAISGGRRRQNEAYQFFRSLCAAHIEVINKFINQYRYSTYDLFAYQISTLDVPIWHIASKNIQIPVSLLDYALYEYSPSLVGPDGKSQPIHFVQLDALQAAMRSEPSPGEMEFLDAINLNHRGDYSGAVRRVVTAIEVILEAKLREEYAKRFTDEADIEKELGKTWNNFEDRLTEYLRVSKRHVPPPFIHFIPWLNGLRLRRELENARTLRHAIVHRGLAITYNNQGYAHRAVETMRWLYNWFEDRPERQDVRERKLALRGLPTHRLYFPFKITPEGVVIKGGSVPAEPRDFLGFLKGLVENEGEQLVDSVQTALRLLGFEKIAYTSKDLDGSRYLEDLRVHDLSPILLLAVDSPHGFPATAIIGRISRFVLKRSREWNRQDIHGLYLVNHQPPIPGPERDHVNVFSEAILNEAIESKIGLMTAWDFYLLIQGMERLNWPREVVQKTLFGTGRTGLYPSHYSFAGEVAHVYERSNAVRIEMTGKVTLRIGDTVGYKTENGYLEETITSLQKMRNPIGEAHPGERVGSTTGFSKNELPVGSKVFLVNPLPPRQKYLFKDLDEIIPPLGAT